MRYDRVTTAMALPDPIEALSATLREVCRAWERAPQAIRRVLALAILDPEIGEVVERYELARRAPMTTLARRLQTPVGADAAAALLGALTNPLTYFQFRVGIGPQTAARRLAHAAFASLGLPIPKHARPRAS